MDSESDVEPPSKVSKQEDLTPSRATRLKEYHVQTLQQYGINSEFRVTAQLDAVNNEVVCSLMMLKISKMEIFRITKEMLGLDGDEPNGLSRFRRKLLQIEKEYKLEQKKQKDKSLTFLKNIAFDTTFFAFDDIEKSPAKFLHEIPASPEIIGEGSGYSNPSVFRETETQTEPYTSVDLSWPANIPIFEKKSSRAVHFSV